MQVYDLDKTQQWLDRTMAIRKDPPVRGGGRTDHRARRQTLAGVGIVALALGLLLLRPQPPAVVPEPPMSRIALPAIGGSPDVLARPANPAEARTSTSLRDRRPLLGVMQQPRQSRTKIGAEEAPRAAPPAPIWLD